MHALIYFASDITHLCHEDKGGQNKCECSDWIKDGLKENAFFH